MLKSRYVIVMANRKCCSVVKTVEFTDDVSRFSCRSISDEHIILSDLTKDQGGNNLGPAPKKLLYAALGSCTAMTIRTVHRNSVMAACDKSAWKNSHLSRIEVIVSEKGDHPHVPTKICIAIRLVGNLTQLQKDSLLRSASKCPVKQIISGDATIETSLIEGPFQVDQ